MKSLTELLKIGKIERIDTFKSGSTNIFIAMEPLNKIQKHFCINIRNGNKIKIKEFITWPQIKKAKKQYIFNNGHLTTAPDNKHYVYIKTSKTPVYAGDFLRDSEGVKIDLSYAGAVEVLKSEWRK